MSFKHKFSNLGQPKRIWTVSAIHGALNQLRPIHKTIYDKFEPGDRLVYTGNYLGGASGDALGTMNELLYFRRSLMAKEGVRAEDIVYLRGQQEEMWSKILQLQFAPNPPQLVEWMAAHVPGLDGMLLAYGSSLEELRRTAREGTMSLTRWSNGLKLKIRETPGHEAFQTILRRAAFTEHKTSNDNNILFVHAGLNPARPLTEQGDSFWWGSRNFNDMAPYSPFRAVVRGHDPELGGVQLGPSSISLDGGCGRGGKLVCAQLSCNGDVLEIIAA
ncbi:MAG TPA: hypothetical protein VEF76_00535 [Patescibacteria group bacterium]|nr:hypothetical protein [Patescibacteria group bacterium]